MPFLRLMVFVDGENLLHRFEHMVTEGHEPSPNLKYEPGAYVWAQGWMPGTVPYAVTRTTYYTAVTGDEVRVKEVTGAIKTLRFEPMRFKPGNPPDQVTPIVFKKEDRHEKTKAVDIQMVVDILHHVHQGNVDAVAIISGDGDFLPVVDEVIRNGKHVYLGALSTGLNERLKERADQFVDLDKIFFPVRPT
jgi:hypothetical protein